MMAAAAVSSRGSSLDPDAAAFIARFTTPPDSTRTNAINTLFLSLKSTGIFSKLDSLYVGKKRQDDQSGVLDLIRTTKSATLYGTASIDVDYGFTAPNSIDSAYITTGYTASSDGVNYTPNSAGIGFYLTKSPKDSASVRNVGARDSDLMNATTLVSLLYDGGNDNLYLGESYINGLDGCSEVDRVASNAVGIMQINRTASDLSDIYYCGVHLGTNTTNNTGRTLNSNEFLINGYNELGVHKSYNGPPHGAWWAGAPLNTTEQSDFKAALDAYFSAL